MSHDSVELASLQGAVKGQGAQIERLIDALRGVGRPDQFDGELHFCHRPAGALHTPQCLAARRELELAGEDL